MKNLDSFLEIEKELNLFDMKINGCDLWSYCRAYVFVVLNGMVGMASGNLVAQPPTQGLRARALAALRALHKASHKLADVVYAALSFRRLRKADICLINSPRKKWVENSYWCIYTDDLAASLPSSLVIDLPFEPRLLRPVPNPGNHLFLHAWLLPAKIAIRLLAIFQRRKYASCEQKVREVLAPVFLQLEEAYAQTFDWSWCVKETTRWALLYPFLYRLYHRLLRRIEPKVLVTTCHQSLYYRLAMEVAKDLGISTIELQHGIIDPVDIGYNYPPGTGIKQFADNLFVFSDFWKHSARFPIAPEHILPVGYPYCERRVRETLASQQKTDSIPTIVFLSQLKFSGHMWEIAVALERALSEKEIRILYKLHPTEFDQWRDLYPQLVDTKIEVVDRCDIDVYDCFAQADIQIGTTSTAIYEGLAFGLETYILRTDEFDNNLGSFKSLCENGYATAFSTVEELIALLKNRTGAAKKEKKTFWEMDAITNMQTAIQQIIDEHQTS